MPQGIEAVVEGGFATISFPDGSKRGPALQALLDDVGPELVDIDTSGERKKYIVPASAAEKAGLLDSAEEEPELTPHQRAARTRAANKATADKAAAEAAQEAEAAAAGVDPDQQS